MPAARTALPALALLAALAPVAALPSQQFVDLAPRRQFPALQIHGKPTMAFADVDGDGATDIALAGEPQGMLFVNDGFGRYTETSATRLPPQPQQPALFADVDGDGDPDLVTMGPGLYRNNGGVFVDVGAASLPATAATLQPTAVATGDVDGDGDLDLLLAGTAVGSGSSVAAQLWLNQGGVFTDVTTARMPNAPLLASELVLADLDGDGDLDLAIACGKAGGWISSAGQNRLYLNDGSGGFTDATAGRLPVHNDSSSGVAAGDLDNDGDLDLVFSNEFQVALGGPPVTEENRIYLNDGAGSFVEIPGAQVPSTGQCEDVALADLDGDGFLDIVFGASSVGANVALHNRGNVQSFADATEIVFPMQVPACSAVGVLDANGDGRPDLLVAGNGFNGIVCGPTDGIATRYSPSRLLGNDGTGRLRDLSAGHRLARREGNTRDMAVADLDRDGHLDLVLAKWEGPGQVLLGDGSGRYARALPFQGATGGRGTAVALADVDGDGNLDLAEGTAYVDRLYLGDGRGGFVDVTATHLPLGVVGTKDLAFADADADGDPDLLVAAFGGVRFYEDIGFGRYRDATAGRMPPLARYCERLAVADLDGDGDLDVAVGSTGGNALLFNDGGGRFTDVTAGNLPGSTWFQPWPPTTVVAGDIDGDGDIDLMFGGTIAGIQLGCYTGTAAVMINDGSGRFTDESGRLNTQCGGQSMSLGDVDGDGDLDLVAEGSACCPFAAPTVLLRNDGNGFFAQEFISQLDHGMTGPGLLALADVDRDGDADLLAAGAFDHVFLNVERQIAAPFDAVPGALWRLELRARLVSPMSSYTAYPQLSVALANPPIQLPGLGVYFLDPFAAFNLGAVSLPRQVGQATIELRVPPFPGLVGLPFHAQALIVDDLAPRGWFTGVLSDRVRR